MKLRLSILSFLLITSLSLVFTSCEELEDSGDELTNSAVVEGLKEALSVGTTNAVALASEADGFINNETIRILLPPEAEEMVSFLEELKAHPELIEVAELQEAVLDLTEDDIHLEFMDELIYEMNHAAEISVAKAKPIFLSAITSLSISDGFAILQGADNAATEYLKEFTSDDLFASFHPEVIADLADHNVQETWATLLEVHDICLEMQAHDQLPGLTTQLQPIVNTQLTDFTTLHSMEGLFHLIAEEEANIRNNASARVTDILKTIFGG